MKNKIVITTDGTETLARLYERSIYCMTQLIFKEGTNLPNMILQKSTMKHLNAEETAYMLIFTTQKRDAEVH